MKNFFINFYFNALLFLSLACATAIAEEQVTNTPKVSPPLPQANTIPQQNLEKLKPSLDVQKPSLDVKKPGLDVKNKKKIEEMQSTINQAKAESQALRQGLIQQGLRLVELTKSLEAEQHTTFMLQAELRKERDTTQKLSQELSKQKQILIDTSKKLDSELQITAKLNKDLHQIQLDNKNLNKQLNEVKSTSDKLSSDLKNSNEKNLSLAKDIDQQNQKLTLTNQTLNAERQITAKLHTELQQSKLTSDDLSKKLANNEQLLVETKNALEAERHTIAGLQVTIKQEQGEIVTLRQQILALRAAAASNGEALAVARTLLPERDGGTATLEIVKEKIHAVSMQLTQYRGRVPSEVAAKEEYQKIVEQLGVEQMRLAMVMGAKGVHRLRSSDTLQKIATAHYGKKKRWKEIYQNNQHVLDNENKLPADFTLVIP